MDKETIEQTLYALEDFICHAKEASVATYDAERKSEYRELVAIVQGWYEELCDYTGHTWGRNEQPYASY
jgi:hypothetical protein